MGETKYFGYNSDAEFRQAVAAEFAAQEAEARQSKPLHASELAREAAPTSDDLVVQASQKLAQALTAHKGEIGVNETFADLQQMLYGATSAEAAALAVVAFAQHPDYAENAVEAMQETWGDWADEALQETVLQLTYVEAMQESEQQQQAYDAHVAHRAQVMGDLSDQIAQKDGEAVRQVTAQIASQDEDLMWENDVDATATLMGYRGLAKAGKASAEKQAFLREFDKEVEIYGPRKGTDAERDAEGFRREQEAATSHLVNFDPEVEFIRGHTDALRRVGNPVVGFPFDEAEFDEEARKYEKPSHSTPEAIKARDAREQAEQIRLFGEPSRPLGS